MSQIRFNIITWAATLFLISCNNLSHETAEDSLSIANSVDQLVDGVLEDIGVPVGVGVAIFANDSSFAQGFGLADIDTGELVTADTAFYIASSTKSFNALAMNVLHHRGDLDLDSTLAQFAPDASFPDEALPDQVVLRDLLTHTSGITNTPIMYRSAYTGVHTPELLWSLLDESSANSNVPYGSFEYTNTGYNILTILTDRKLGIAWQDLVNREIITPLGLTRTTSFMSEVQSNKWALAKPHGLREGGRSIERLYLEKADSTMQSAGGMVMSANDAKLWLELFVNEGNVGGAQIFDQEIILETRERLAQVNREFGDYLREDYGIGWYISSYNGELMIHHFGSFSGFRAHVSYLPNRREGVAVFVNNSHIGSFLADSLANYIYDLLAERISSTDDLNDARNALSARYQRLVAQVDRGRSSRALRTWQLTVPRSAFEGAYRSERLGTITVEIRDGEFYVEMGRMHAIAQPFIEPNTMRVELAPPEGSVLEFEVNSENVVTAVSLAGERLERL